MSTITVNSKTTNNSNITNTKILSPIENFILSGIAAVGGKTAAAPLERIKLLIQNEKEMIKSERLNISYASPMECFKRVLNEEGVISLWRGNLANCMRYLPSQALNFMFKEKIKQLFEIKDDDNSLNKLYKNTISGSIAGLISLTFVYSLDYTRTRLANDILTESNNKRQFKGLFDVYKQTIKTDGFIGLYRGYIISCYTVIIYRGIYFGMYDTLKPILFINDKNNNFVNSFLLGFGITTIAGIIVYPLDTIRRRMMMRSGEFIKYNGSIDCFNYILKMEGFRSLYKGCLVNVFRNVSGAGTLAGYDFIKKYYIKYLD